MLAVIEFSSAENINSTIKLTLVDETGSLLEEMPLSQGGGLYKNIFSTPFIAEYDQFKFLVSGMDNKGHRIQRISSTLIKSGKVELIQAEPGLTTEIKPGDVLKVPFNVSNFGTSDTFKLKAVGDLKIMNSSVEPTMVNLRTNETFQFNVILSASSSSSQSETNTVAVSVLHTSGTLVNYKVLYVTFFSQVRLLSLAPNTSSNIIITSKVQ